MAIAVEPQGQIRHLQQQVHQTAQSKGWWDTADDANVPTKLALIHSEISEALETYRAGKVDLYYQWRDPDDGKLKRLTPEEVEQKANEADTFDPSLYKPAGFGIEMADAIIRIFDLVEWMDIDIEALTLIKMQYNETRPMRHGGKKV